MARAGALILAIAAIAALGPIVWAVVRSGDRATPTPHNAAGEWLEFDNADDAIAWLESNDDVQTGLRQAAEGRTVKRARPTGDDDGAAR